MSGVGDPYPLRVWHTLEVVTLRPFIERRWRWSWLRMCWQVQTLSEDYVFTYDGGCLEGMEPWSAV